MRRGCEKNPNVILSAVLFTMLMIGFLPTSSVIADTNCTAQVGANGQPSTYCLLAPLPTSSGGTPTSQTTFSDYIVNVMKLAVGVAAALAVLMIVWGGIKYMTSDVISNKASAKTSIQNALLGLLLALASYTILNTINKDLITIDILLPPLPAAPNLNTVAPGTNNTNDWACDPGCVAGYTCNVDTGECEPS